MDIEQLADALLSVVEKPLAALAAKVDAAATDLAAVRARTEEIAREVAVAQAKADASILKLQEDVAAIRALPAPADGKDGAPGADGEKGDPGCDGKDGVGSAGALIDRDGCLVMTMTNGEVKSLGLVVGSDGAPGRDGADGKDGADGLGFEDMDFEEKDGRLYAVFRRGDVVKSARIPGISYRGVWKAGDYMTGDSVTFGSCQWIATEDTTDKPGEGKGWQLAVRKGRDATARKGGET